jgi:DNA gyrase subunit A
VRSGRLHGITDLRDESDRDGLRIVIDLQRDVVPRSLLRQLYEWTPMQSPFAAALVALTPDADTGGVVPRLVSLKQMLALYIAHRDDCIARRAGTARDPSKPERMELLKEELLQIAARFGDPRRTEILER